MFIEQVLVLMIFFKALYLLIGLETAHGFEVPETINVVSFIIGPEHNVVYLDVEVHIS